MMQNRLSAVLGTAVAIGWCNWAAAAEVKVAPYGVSKDGHKVTAYTLVNDSGASATILDHGARVAAIRVPDRNGKLGNTVMSFADMRGWESLGYYNTIVGRVANVILNGFTLDGVRYPLKPGPNGVTMHSATGYTGYGERMWAVEPIRRSDGAAVTLTLDSPDGDQGFPGHVKVRVTYRFTNDNALRLDFSATTDKATPINLTNHLYFNLNGNSTTPVYDHDLQVMSDRIAPLNPATGGEIGPVAGAPYDFTKPTPLRERLGLALGPEYATPGRSLPVPPTMLRIFNLPFFADNRLDRVAARLHDPASGRVLEVRTTEPSVHVFTPLSVPGDHLSDVGKPFTRAPSIALETQHLPDSPNRPEFPSVILRPGQTFRSTTIFAFKTDANP